MVADPLRAWASPIVAGMFLVPALVPMLTVAWNENTLLPALTSPLVPLSKKVCDAPPPIAVRSALTARPVLVGLAPGVTETVSRVIPPGWTVLGLAAPTPEGSIGPD